MDKPAEGLARVVPELIQNALFPGGGQEVYRLTVGGVRLNCYANFGEVSVVAALIDSAHESIVKPLREKAERAEENRDGWKDQAERNESIAGDALKQLDEMTKDRDAWKAEAHRHIESMTELIEDAGRLAEETVKSAKVSHHYAACPSDKCPSWENHISPAMKEALAAHEALKGNI